MTRINSSPPDTKQDLTIRPVIISCFVDDQPLFHLQAWIWLHSLSKALQSDKTGIIVHHCNPLPMALLDKIAEVGAKSILVKRYGTGPAAYCNKLQQFETLITQKAEHFILCDTDLAFLRSPEILCTSKKIKAKVVDKPNPSAETLKVLFAKANLEEPTLKTDVDFAPKTYTHRYNCNGGIYIIPADLLSTLAPIWRHWTEYCIQEASLLGPAALHADQLGFMFAMDQLQLPFEALNNKHNFPLHFPAKTYEVRDFETPDILHYHRQLNVEGFITELAVPILRKRIKDFNCILRVAHDDTGFCSLLHNWRDELSGKDTK